MMLTAGLGLATLVALQGPSDPGLEQGVAFLVQEVPRWSQDHGCFSCHHNGDGARALVAARAAGFAVPEEALADSLAWLGRPDGWDDPGEDAPFRDVDLARLQFAAALRDGVDQGTGSRAALEKSSTVLVGFQDADGSWPADTGGAPGSPITWGATLATAQGWAVLRDAAEETQQAAQARAREWLLRQRPQRVLDAAALLTTLPRMDAGEAVEAARLHCREVLAKAAPSAGGFGPFQGSPPEVFDTAMVMLALAPYANEPDVADTLAAARRYLLLQQDLDGSWPPTTRPGGADSEAHRLSTSAWAVLALVRVAEVLEVD